MLVPTWMAIQQAFDGRRIILAWPVARVTRRWVEWLGTLGLESPFVLALFDGPSKPLPLPADQICILRSEEIPARDPEERLFEDWEDAMRNLPPAARARIDAWDPTNEAVVLVPAATQLNSVAGRRVYGGTPAVRHEIENKVTVDALFDRLDIPTAPRQVVDVASAAAAAVALDQGHGTVWAGDNTSTIEAGARALAHVFDAESAQRAQALLAPRCRTVRIQPFLAGVPCSIQGICTPDGVALTVPTEMLVLRDPERGEFQLVGMSTAWDPPSSVTTQLRTYARRVGEHLRTVHAWRGGFSVDAIARPEGGIWPTEINARMSAGLTLLDGVLPGPSLELMERLLREGHPIGVTAEHLERWMARPLRARRTNLVRLGTPTAPAVEHRVAVAFDPVRVVQAPQSSGTLEWVAEGHRGVIRLELDPIRHPQGERVGPRVEQALQLAAELWKLPVAHWRAAH